VKELVLSIGEPFTSPAWGSNFVMFSAEEKAVIQEEDAREYLRRICKYARRYEVYLIPQRFEMMGTLCMCLISPQGRVIGAQKAAYLHLPSVYERGDSLEVLRTEFGGVFLCVDVDIYHPQIHRIAANMGAQYLFCAQSIEALDYDNNMVVTGIWNAAQSGGFYAVAVSQQFHCVCAPLALTPKEDGFLAAPTRRTPLSVRMQADDLLSSLPPRRRLSRKLYAVHRGDLLE